MKTTEEKLKSAQEVIKKLKRQIKADNYLIEKKREEVRNTQLRVSSATAIIAVMHSRLADEDGVTGIPLAAIKKYSDKQMISSVNEVTNEIMIKFQ